jgi:ATP-binding cassette subfamily B protein
LSDSLKKLLSHFSNKKWDIYVGAIYSILNKVFDIAPPLLIGLAVDTVVKKQDSFLAGYGIKDQLNQIYIIAILTFIIWGLESLFEFLFKVKWRELAQAIQHDLRLETYTHMQSLHMSFFENQNTGNLTSIINDDVNQLERFLDVGLNDIIQTITTVICVGLIFFMISPNIALLSFLPIPFILAGSFYFQYKVAPRYKKVREEAGHLASMLVTNIGGMATIKAYVAQDFETKRLSTQSLNYVNSNRSAIQISSLFSPLIRMVVLCGFLLTMIVGATEVFEGVLEVGSYSVLIFLVQRLLWPLTRLGETFDLYQRSMASIERIFSLLQTKTTIHDGERTDGELSGSIKFNDVTFAYDEHYPIIKILNLEVIKGSTVAIVGTTGSGKSTLVKLLLRLYDTTEGSITIDDQDIKSFHQNFLRSQISFVSQDTYLFHGSVYDNIKYGSFDRSPEQVRQAARMAEAHDFIELLPNGYETIVGERGQKLSGGQRQRIAIARAILKDTGIFIFDEATSAVDNETEAAIQRSLKLITQLKTTIMVAHRLSTIRHADLIYVFEKGNIAESGTHEQLLELGGLYKSLWSLQAGES